MMKLFARRVRTGLVGVTAIAAVGLATAGGAQAAFPKGANGSIAMATFDASSSGLALIHPDGSSRSPLISSNTLDYRAPAWSPTGRRLVYTQVAATTNDLFSIKPDGSGAVNLTNTPGPTFEGAAAFAPDGSAIAYHLEDVTQSDIWRMNADGSGQVNLTNTGSANEFAPDFSPDGGRIVYQGPGTGGEDIWVMNADGSAPVNLTNTPGASEFDPAFSPDGRSIVFIRYVTSCEIFVMSSAGGPATDLSNTAAFDECDPVFSPDGRKIVYETDDGPQDDVYTMNADGSGQTNITNTPAPQNELGVSWQPIQKCGGRRVTIVGDDGPDKIKGTKKPDVIAGFGGRDVIRGLGGSDRICGGSGRDKLVGGPGAKDMCSGGAGKDKGSACERGKL